MMLIGLADCLAVRKDTEGLHRFLVIINPDQLL